jgi:cytochrome c oxidase assembly protein subunit 15
MVLLYVGWLSLHVIRRDVQGPLARYGLLVLVMLLAQSGLGIMNVLARLPLAVAVAHNVMAALLLATLVTLYHVVRPVRKL